MVETYPRDIFEREAAAAAGSEGGDDALQPLNPDSLVKKVVSAKDRTIFHPAPTEDGVPGVADAKIWARVQATVRGAMDRSKCRGLLTYKCMTWHDVT